ncbi:MAG TPA: dTMP kinase [Streptosporangiaceae bacterium]|nr:dTMP kinase [Streptosporangiaceae bacterium]
MNFQSPLGVRGPGVLSITPFRRLWVALTLSSLGDWISLLALSALAAKIGGLSGGGYAVSGVWLTSLLPALVFGPLAGAVADKFDRRMNLIIGDVIRASLYVTIPINLSVGFANQLTWIYIVQFLASCASLFWTPAKDASVPNLVPPEKLEQANQLSLFATYGTAPIAGLLFALLALISTALGHISHYFSTNQVSLALYFNAATYVVSALTVYTLRELRRQQTDRISSPSVLKSIWEGWQFVRHSQVVRGIVLGMTGAFAAAGAVVGLGPSYIRNILQGGSAGWGAAFAAIFFGLAIGMFLGLRVLAGFSRRRLFGVSIMFAALPLAAAALIPSLVLTVILVIVIGACAGVAYVTGYTTIGLEVDDETRGRTFAFLQSAIRVILFAVIAIAPTLAGGFNSLARAMGASSVHIADITYRNIGYNLVLLLAAVVAVLLGRMSYRQMDDRRGVPLLADLGSALRHDGSRRRAEVAGNGAGDAAAAAATLASASASTLPVPKPVRRPGVLLALEGGEGAGKSTQARLLAIWLRDQGYDVVTTYEPGATKVGMRLRALLLDTAHAGLSARAEALMYAADRAEHVDSVIIPALERGAIVVTDRYVDSSLAYQGAGRQLPLTDIAELNRWATSGLVPDLTVVLDLSPATGLSRRLRSADRLESEPIEFHQRVRDAFLRLAAAEPRRYLVVDAARPEGQVSREIQLRVRDVLPDPVPSAAEENTGSFPAVRE